VIEESPEYVSVYESESVCAREGEGEWERERGREGGRERK